MLKRGFVYAVSFIIYLLVTLPIYGSVVWAEILNAEAFGNDYVSGLRKKDDDTYIRVNVTPLTGEPDVAASQLKIGEDPSRSFSCALVNNVTKQYSCSAFLPGAITPGERTLTLQFIPLGGGGGQNIPLKFLVDDKAPRIDSLSIKTTGSRIDANYSITEKGCDSCAADVCAGVSYIRFTSNGAPVYSKQIAQKGNCSIKEAVNYTVVILGTQNRTLCLDVYDQLGQKGSKCQEVTLDMTVPSITSLNFTYSNQEVPYVRDQPIGPVTLLVTIKEDVGISANDISADLSALNENPTLTEAYKAKKPDSCSGSSGSYKCYWTSLLVFITQSNPSATFFLKDVSGNENNVTIATSLLVDNTPPVVQSISTGKVDQKGRIWAGIYGNTITVGMQEADSGFNKKWIALDFSAFGGQAVVSGSKSNYILRPNNCTPGWSCAWDNIGVTFVEPSGLSGDSITHEAIPDLEDPISTEPPVINDVVFADGRAYFIPPVDPTTIAHLLPVPSGSILPITVVYPSADDAGNLVTGKTTEGIFFDGIPPQIVDNEMTYPCPTSEEEFEWILTVKDVDSGEPSITYDQSEVSLTPGNRTELCEEGLEPGLWECRLIIDNLPSYGIEDVDIPFWLSDLAGNTLATTYEEVTGHEARVCEAVEGAPPNLITIQSVKVISGTYKDGDKSKPAIDRKVASFAEYPIFFDVELYWVGHPSTDKIEIIGTSVDSCTLVDPEGTTGSVTSFFNIMEFNQSHPFIETKVALGDNVSAEIGKDSVEMNCNLSFRVRYGTKLYKLPETDSFPDDTIVYLTDSPIGFINDTVMQKLLDIKNDYKDRQETIDDLTTLNYIFGTICAIVQIAVLLFEVIVLLKFVFLIIAQIDYFKSVWTSTAGFLSKIEGLVGKWLWNPPGMGVNYASLGTWLRVICGFYTCKLGDATKLMRIIPMIASAGETIAFGGGEADFLESGTISSGSNTYDAYDLNYDGLVNTQTGLSGRGSTKLVYDPDKGTATLPTTGGSMGEAEAPEGAIIAASIPIASTFSNYHFDPYKSIYNAMSTMCVPMIIYNLEKMQQIKCLQFRCIVNRVQAGFDASICDELASTRECLYYYGAAFRYLDGGYTMNVFKTLVGIWMGETITMSLALAQKAACTAAYDLDTGLNNLPSDKEMETGGAKTAEIVLSALINPAVAGWNVLRKNYDPTLYFDIDFLYQGKDLKPEAFTDTGKAAWAIWGACDLMGSILYGIDSGDWLYYKGSWDVSTLYDHLGKPDYCSGIEDLK